MHACKEAAPPEFVRVAIIDRSIDNGKFWGNTEIIYIQNYAQGSKICIVFQEMLHAEIDL
jgi:hypothetical protein